MVCVVHESTEISPPGEDIAHSWRCTPAEAIAIQKRLSGRVVIGGRPAKLDFVAGVDLAFEKARGLGFCVIIIFEFPSMNIVEERCAADTVAFPYIPGLLSFREGPLILQAYNMLEKKPECIIFDGQGIAHPRRLGIASHLGLLLDVPSIGCAKSRLYGRFEELAPGKGARAPLVDDAGGQVGVVLRTRTGVKPVFVSPGHRVGVEEAADIVMACAGRYRVPEPTRLADIRVEKFKRDMLDTCAC